MNIPNLLGDSRVHNRLSSYRHGAMIYGLVTFALLSIVWFSFVDVSTSAGAAGLPFAAIINTVCAILIYKECLSASIRNKPRDRSGELVYPGDRVAVYRTAFSDLENIYFFGYIEDISYVADAPNRSYAKVRRENQQGHEHVFLICMVWAPETDQAAEDIR